MVARAVALLSGVGVGRGAVCGPVAQCQPPLDVAPDAAVGGDPAESAAILDEAFAHVAQQLRELGAATPGTVGEVLAATADIAADPALRSQVRTRIAAGEPPVAAVDAVVDGFAQMFTAAGGYLAERVTDLRSVRERVVARALGLATPGVPALTRPSVVVARDLAPADTAALDLDKVLAIVTELGGATGHTAIIAGQLGIPCVVQVAGATSLADGTVVGVDAKAGTVLVDPDADVRDAYTRRRAALDALTSDTAAGATADGHEVALLVNIGTPVDATRAAGTPAQGVGLFRTEVLFLDSATAPTVEDQAEVYADVLDAMGDKKVVVRTLDAGADKPLAFATQPDEENPALGIRGYRLVRTSPELLDSQLAALALAQERTGRAPWVMAPMVSTPGEARAFAAAARAHGVATVGVMVEVPAAALHARAILAEVDFVSLGTNDLAQYTMATDRLQGRLADLLDPWQPAVLELVAITARAGVDAEKPVGVCGESAADPLMALVLTGMGVTSLSMSPAALPTVRYALRHHSLAQCAAMADAALGAADAPGARRAVAERLDPDTRATLL